MSEVSSTSVSTQDEIKKVIKKFIEVDQQITQINKGLKDLKLQKKGFEEIISQFMLDNKIGSVELDKNNMLKISKKKVNKTVSKTTVIETLVTTLGEIKGEEIANEIYGDDKDAEEVVQLQYKKSKSKSKSSNE